MRKSAHAWTNLREDILDFLGRQLEIDARGPNFHLTKINHHIVSRNTAWPTSLTDMLPLASLSSAIHWRSIHRRVIRAELYDIESTMIG